MFLPFLGPLNFINNYVLTILQDWGNRDSWRTQIKPCVHQDPAERSSDAMRE